MRRVVSGDEAKGQMWRDCVQGEGSLLGCDGKLGPEGQVCLSETCRPTWVSGGCCHTVVSRMLKPFGWSAVSAGAQEQGAMACLPSVILAIGSKTWRDLQGS